MCCEIETQIVKVNAVMLATDCKQNPVMEEMDGWKKYKKNNK